MHSIQTQHHSFRYIVSNEGHLLSVENRPQGDIALRLESSDDPMQDNYREGCLTLVPKSRESNVSRIFYNTVCAIINSKQDDLEKAKACLPFIPKDKKVSINCFDYLPTLTGNIDQDGTPQLTINSHTATMGWAWNKFDLTMTFKQKTSGTPSLMDEHFNSGLLYAVILAMHIAQKPESDEIYSTLLEQENYSDDVFSHLPTLVQRLDIK